jgi:hypothetical protein
MPKHLPRPRTFYYGTLVIGIISVQDVTDLAHRAGAAHALKKGKGVMTAMDVMKLELPFERPYMPLLLNESTLRERECMLPGQALDVVKQIGMGKISY